MIARLREDISWIELVIISQRRFKLPTLADLSLEAVRKWLRSGEN